MQSYTFKPGDSVSFTSRKRVLFANDGEAKGIPCTIRGKVQHLAGEFVAVKTDGITCYLKPEKLTLEGPAKD